MSISLSAAVTFCGWFHQTFVCISCLDRGKKDNKQGINEENTGIKDRTWICVFLKANRNLQTCKLQAGNDFYVQQYFCSPEPTKKKRNQSEFVEFNF